MRGAGILVNVPDPARYAVHKLIVSERRQNRASPKVGKDINQAAALLEVLLRDDPAYLQDCLTEARSRGPRWVAAIDGALERVPVDIQQALGAG